MNPTAQEFIPRKKRTADPLYTQQPNPYAQHPPQPTKLRASAPAFVPKGATPPPPMPPAFQPLAVVPSPSPALQGQPPRHVNSGAPLGVEPQPLPGPRHFSLSAAPYTPANPKAAARLPPVPPQTPPPPNAAATDCAQTTGGGQSPPKEKPQAPAGENQAASAPQESSATSTPATDENNNNNNNNNNNETSTVLNQIDVIGDALENDFSGSALPSLFDVKDVAKPPPSEPLRFNTVWALYADDHPTPFGAPLAYDPVLVHLVGDMECFWRLWHYLPPPSALVPAFTYHWFRRDIKPNWEHARNKNGGTITIVIFDRDKPGQNSKQTMDDAFMTMLMACCGETLAESTTNLNGIMLKVRQNKPTTLQLWTASSDQRKLKALAGSLRTLLEKVIGAKPMQKLEYFSHQQTQVGGPGSLAGRMKGKPTRITPDFTL